MFAQSSAIFVAVIIASVCSHPSYRSSTNLNPVHGLYVKPSSDGSKGDLFVAATEENGAKSQWMVDQPVNFLPVAATTQPQANTLLPVPCPGITTHHEESATQKRTAVPSTGSIPQIQYAYTLPVPSSDNNPTTTYAYAYPVSFNTEVPASKCESSSSTSHYPLQFPYQLFYPQIMSAYSNGMTILKEAGLSEDAAHSAIAHHASPMWPSSPYGYPMYVMISPSSWTQTQDLTTTSTPTPSPSSKEEVDES